MQNKGMRRLLTLVLAVALLLCSLTMAFAETDAQAGQPPQGAMGSGQQPPQMPGNNGQMPAMPERTEPPRRTTASSPRRCLGTTARCP